MHKFQYLLALFVIVSSCQSYDSKNIEGTWIVTDINFEETKGIQIPDSLKTEYDDAINSIKKLMRDDIGSQWIFNDDKSFIATNAEKNKSYWKWNPVSMKLYFSYSLQPFEVNYTFDSVFIKSDTLFVTDIHIGTGKTITKLVKSKK